MKELYPLKFKPILKEKIWGGTGIKDVLGLNTGSLLNCGEAWMVSGVADNVSVVSNGFLAGNNLNELIDIYMSDLVGDDVFDKFGSELPLLVKIIDTTRYLSVQVHPDDKMAIKKGLPNGKNEMWYIMEAGSDSKIINGFSKGINADVFKKHLNSKKLKEILTYLDVKAGDVFNIPAGRIHAIGPGIMLAEIQQSSDTTYRVYDWDREDEKGRQRELHTDLAIEAMDYKVPDQMNITYKDELNRTVHLLESPHFNTNLLTFGDGMVKDYSALDSFVIQLCTDGAYNLISGNHKSIIKRGEAVLIPASTEKIQLIPDRRCTLLESYII